MLITAVFLLALAGGCGSGRGARDHSAAKPAITPSQATAAEVTSLLAGIRQRGSTLGDPQAPVTVEYYADLQCPTCASFHSFVGGGLSSTILTEWLMRSSFSSMNSSRVFCPSSVIWAMPCSNPFGFSTNS